MSIEENKIIVRRLYEEFFNQGNLAVADELIAPNYVNHSAPPQQVPGPEGVKQRSAALRTAFPDFRNTIEDIVAEGDRVVVRVAARGTHKGMHLGVHPTGKPVMWTGVDIFVIHGGKLMEGWGFFDELSLLKQLGRSTAQEKT